MAFPVLGRLGCSADGWVRGSIRGFKRRVLWSGLLLRDHSGSQGEEGRRGQVDINCHLCVLRIGTDRDPFPSGAYILENINIVTKLL